MIDVVALAGRRFEALAVEDPDVPATISDEPGAMEFPEGRRDPGAADAEHGGHEFMRHRYDIRSGAVVRHQQPAGAALFHRMEAIAGGSLRAQIHEGFGEPEHRPAHCRALVERRLAPGGAYAQRRPWHLHDDLLSRCLAAEKGGP